MPLLFIRQDLTLMETDAIVNPADPSLMGEGGLDASIHKAAGPQLRKYCRGLGGCRPGEAKITPAFDMKCRFIIHTVTPAWTGAEEEKALLRNSYRACLQLAEENGCASVAFPMIGTGKRRYPRKTAFRIAVDTIREFLLTHDMLIYLVLFDRESMLISGLRGQELSSLIDDVYAEKHMDRRRDGADGGWAGVPKAKSADWDKDDEAPDTEDADEGFIGHTVAADAVPVMEPPKAAPASQRCCSPLPPKVSYKASARLMPRPANVPAGLAEQLGRLGESFRDMLLRKIDETGMTDAMCYTRANQDRRLFNKIKNQPGYHPGKMTVLSFAIALRLSLKETEEMLMKAGYAFSHAEVADVIICYFISARCYDIYTINEALYHYDQAQLGNVSA